MFLSIFSLLELYRIIIIAQIASAKNWRNMENDKMKSGAATLKEI